MLQHLLSSSLNSVQRFKDVNSNLESHIKPKLQSPFKPQLEFVTFIRFIPIFGDHLPWFCIFPPIFVK